MLNNQFRQISEFCRKGHHRRWFAAIAAGVAVLGAAAMLGLLAYDASSALALVGLVAILAAFPIWLHRRTDTGASVIVKFGKTEARISLTAITADEEVRDEMLNLLAGDVLRRLHLKEQNKERQAAD